MSARELPEQGPHGPTVSVVVCMHTLDRWDDIVACLSGLSAQTVPPAETILIVDRSAELLSRATAAFPHARVEPNTRRGGTSGARNSGIALATGEVVAFLDDDACPEPDWLERLLAAYDDPDVLAVGGVALPAWPHRRPDHLVPELNWIVGCTYQGQPTERTTVRNLMGCNMSYRRQIFEEIGGFDEEAGRVGLIPMGCEETELCIRIRQRKAGSRVVFEPGAVVHHRVTPERTTWAYLRARSHAEGLSKAAMARLVGAPDATSVEGRYVARVLTPALGRELGRGLRGDPAGWRGAAAIVTALGITSLAYLRGRLRPGRGPSAEAALAREVS